MDKEETYKMLSRKIKEGEFDEREGAKPGFVRLQDAIDIFLEKDELTEERAENLIMELSLRGNTLANKRHID